MRLLVLAAVLLVAAVAAPAQASCHWCLVDATEAFVECTEDSLGQESTLEGCGAEYVAFQQWYVEHHKEHVEQEVDNLLP